MKLLDIPQLKCQYNQKFQNKVAIINFWHLLLNYWLLFTNESEITLKLGTVVTKELLIDYRMAETLCVEIICREIR